MLCFASQDKVNQIDNWSKEGTDMSWSVNLLYVPSHPFVGNKVRGN
jgi:hypothetical protein